MEALEQSTPELEIWQPGLRGSRLLLVGSHAFFLKVGEQIDDPAEHITLTPVFLHAFGDDI